MSDWNEYQKLVLSELNRLDAGQSELRDGLHELKSEVTRLRTLAGVWGGAAGLIIGTVLQVINV